MMDLEKGIVNIGNWHRIKQAMLRGSRGEALTVGFLGGSITQGCLSSTPETCYAALVAAWWKAHFPRVQYINGGIGGTTSQFGAARVQEDMLRSRPDVVFVEFSVNDDNTPFFQETYEGLIRQIYSSGAAVVLIHNVRYDNGESAEDMHLSVGRHYDLPCVSMKSTIYPEVHSGRIPNRQITPDDLHPNDAGHKLVASVITDLLDRIYVSEEETQEATMPLPLTDNQYERCIRYQNHNSNPVVRGFAADDTPQEHITQMFRRGYTAWREGDSITFSVEGTGVAVQYRKSVCKPAPIAKVVVDGKEDRAVFLDANFQEDWGDCLAMDAVLFHGEDGIHEVRITIVQAHKEDVVPFYLVSVVGSKAY